MEVKRCQRVLVQHDHGPAVEVEEVRPCGMVMLIKRSPRDAVAHAGEEHRGHSQNRRPNWLRRGFPRRLDIFDLSLLLVRLLHR